MQKVEQHIIHDDRFKDWCVKAKNLYNQVLYYWRQSVFGNIQYFDENELVGLMREYDDPDFRALPSHTSQQIIKFLFKSIKSWQKGRVQYIKNPTKFRGKPKMPNYKKSLSQLYFTDNQFKLHNGFVHFPKMINVSPIKTNIKLIDFCRVIAKSNHFVVEFIYTVKDEPIKEYNGNWLSVDVGLNNLATCSSNVCKPLIINGKPLKSINEFYNKRMRFLQNQLPYGVHTSKRMYRIGFKRNQRVKDYIHKASKEIVRFSLNKKITKIVIGKNEQWKQFINLKKQTNKEFTGIPHATLIEKIQNKALEVGIEVILTQEAYTSKCSALDLEPICKHEKYMGKRKKRGLFVTATGKLINADVNGSLNIARLVLGDEIINSDSIRSCVAQPYKVKNFV